MSTEYGLFNDEGCVERGMWSEAEANARLAEGYTPEDELKVAALCPDHDEQPADGCEICSQEESP